MQSLGHGQSAADFNIAISLICQDNWVEVAAWELRSEAGRG